MIDENEIAGVDLLTLVVGSLKTRRSESLEILKNLRNQELTAIGMANAVGNKYPQNTHGLLEKFRKLGVVIRQKRQVKGRRTQYFYALSNAVNQSDIDDFLSQSEVAASPQKIGRSDHLKLLLDKLPDFNPEWSLEAQESWLAAFSRIVGQLSKPKTSRSKP